MHKKAQILWKIPQNPSPQISGYVHVLGCCVMSEGLRVYAWGKGFAMLLVAYQRRFWDSSPSGAGPVENRHIPHLTCMSCFLVSEVGDTERSVGSGDSQTPAVHLAQRPSKWRDPGYTPDARWFPEEGDLQTRPGPNTAGARVEEAGRYGWAHVASAATPFADSRWFPTQGWIQLIHWTFWIAASHPCSSPFVHAKMIFTITRCGSQTHSVLIKIILVRSPDCHNNGACSFPINIAGIG